MIAKTVLVVDDEQEVLTVIKKRLDTAGYKVLIASSGIKALEMAAKLEPSLILLDIMMPGMDGLEVLRKLKDRNNTAAIPVVMLTAKGESKTIFETQDLGSADYIIKPYDNKELLDIIEKYI